MCYGVEFDNSKIRNLIITISLLASAAVVAIAIPNVVQYFEILGGVFAVFSGAIFPLVIWLKVTDRVGSWKNLAAIGIGTVVVAIISYT
jgi:amino acid permease